ncbi:reverse transcriptase domain-containing protein [Tanacetum coccineum]
MTKSSTSELFTPYKEPEREFRSSRTHFKTLSLDELRSPDFNLFSDQEYSEEEVAETMAETMEQYMIKTRANYGSGVARPKIEDKDNFELKGQFLKENYIVDLFHIPNITIDQVMLRAFPMSLTRAASRWLRNEPTGSITTWDGLKTKFLNKYCPPARIAKKMEEINNFQQEPDENLYQAWNRFKELLMKCPQHYLTKMREVILFYNGLGIPNRQILDSRGAIPSKTAVDVKVAIQEMVKYSQKWHNGTSRSRSTETSDGLAAIQAQKLNKSWKRIKKVNEHCSYPIRRIGSSQYVVSTGQKRTLMYETRQMTIPFPSRLNGYYCDEKKGSYGLQFLEAYSKASHIKNSIPKKDKDPGSFTLTCFINNVCFDNALVDLGASVSVMPLLTYLNLGLGELAHTKLTVELADRTVKYPKGIAENVRVEKEMELDLEARLMGETLVINSSLDPLNRDYIKLNDLNEPFELRRNQGDDLMPTIEEDEVSDEDKNNGISHPYQKLKGFYKGVLNLGPDYIRDAKTEEWLTRGHISVHEME